MKYELNGINVEGKTLNGDQLIYDGGPWNLDHAVFNDVRWTLTGPALNTVQMLDAWWHLLSQGNENDPIGQFENAFPKFSTFLMAKMMEAARAAVEAEVKAKGPQA